MEIQIINYDPQYHAVFKEINLEWLNQYDLAETHDLMVLDNPQKHILDAGGFIWLAEAGGQIVGSGALMKEKKEGEYELAKMTVIPAYRGRGISKLLIEKCLNKAKEIGAKKISLFSNHQLETAIRLYMKYGFKHVAVHDSPFKTADVRMELIL